MSNLWPTDIIKTPSESALTILKKEANNLSSLTSFTASGNVIPFYSNLNKEFEVDFSIAASSIKNYSVKLFKVTYNESLWPVTIYLEQELKDELSDQLETIASKRTAMQQVMICQSKEQFNEKLKLIFNTTRVRNIIQAIISQ